MAKATSSTQFASLLYENAQKEKSKYVINLNVDYERVYRDDLEMLEDLLMSVKTILEWNTLTAEERADKELDVQALEELIKSVKNSLEKGIGNNDAYTQKDVEFIYFQTCDGKHIPNIKMHPDTGQVYVKGFLINKVVVEAGEPKKPTKSRPLTIKKDHYRKMMKISKIREFKLDSADRARLNVETIEF
jgi:hypothetical protein